MTAVRKTGEGTGSDAPGAASSARLLEVGRIVKPHGLRGEVIVSLTSNRTERVEPGSELTAESGRRLKVATSSPHGKRFVVSLEGVDTLEGAESLRDTLLQAAPMDDPDVLWVHDLIGARVRDRAGQELGTVVAVQANPASDLLVLSGGALVPLRFVVSTIPGSEVTVELPDGLLDLP